ncbi:hypothetical protein BGZ65_004429 [Modicella reniformis]|uniref:Uncharacterized protein n=1 Tax=Modicella reniformis TaxID=1440133 RepID=A0A9P6M8Y6_9FUNG|nr:hypothetical protein BGZ65_004429 [Modicella reniformis]
MKYFSYSKTTVLNSDSDVKQFYKCLVDLSSQKSVTSSIVLRAMEKKNKMFRDVARNEFNDTVLKQKQVQADLKEKELLRANAETFQEQEWTHAQEEEVDNENGPGHDNQQFEEDKFDQ